MASNVYSLTQAKTNPKVFPFAIYGEEVVGRKATPEAQIHGFVMHQVWDGIGFIVRLMWIKRIKVRVMVRRLCWR